MIENIHNNPATLAIVIPCYNEETVLPQTLPDFINYIKDCINKGIMATNSFLLCVNDGSSDKTWSIIQDFNTQEPNIVKGICLARNKGHQNAILAGMLYAYDETDVDAIVTIDCDGQDDMHAISKMLEHYYNGKDVVYGVRNDRTTDSFAKRITAESYYKFLSHFGDKSIYNHADYRLLSRRVLAELKKHDEVNLYLRGLIPTIGFDNSIVYYKRQKRIAGKSHYTISKMMNLAIDGLINSGTKPLRLIVKTGIFMTFLGITTAILLPILHVLKICVPIWTITACIGTILTGIQILCLGIAAEYIGKTYIEVKHRPKYAIKETTESRKEQSHDKRV